MFYFLTAADVIDHLISLTPTKSTVKSRVYNILIKIVVFCFSNSCIFVFVLGFGNIYIGFCFSLLILVL